MRSILGGTLLATLALTAASYARGSDKERSLEKMQPVGEVFGIWVDAIDNVEPSIAYNSNHGEYLVVWSNDQGGGTTDIYARRVGVDRTLLSSFTIASIAGSQFYEPDVAYNQVQDEYLVVYSYDMSSTDGDILARRITWNGADLHLPPYQEFRVGRPDSSGKQHRPSVTYNENHNEYLVVYENSWPSHHDIDAVRVNANDGSLPGWRNIVTGANLFRTSPDVACSLSSDNYLVAYTSQPNSLADLGDVLGNLVSWNLGVVSSTIPIEADGPSDQGAVSVTETFGEYLAVFEHRPPGITVIAARRVATDGTLLGSGFSVNDYYWGAQYVSPRVDFASPCGSLVVWNQVTVSGYHAVFGRFVIPGHDELAFHELYLNFYLNYETWAPTVACTSNCDCLVVGQDEYPGNKVGAKGSPQGYDWEIRGICVSLRIFSDGFESGNTQEWSLTNP